MKKILLFVSMCLALSACRGGAEREIRDAVRAQMEAYPESHLSDLYKSFFQDRFGPAHIIRDRASALEYILSEMESADTLVGPYVEPVGWEQRYVRVSLLAVLDGVVSAEDLTDALVASAAPVTEAQLEQWREDWPVALSVIRKTCPDLPDFETESQMIDSLLQAGLYASHHSRAYNAAYHPHYRLLKKEKADSLFAKL